MNISATISTDLTNALFTRLDTKQKGYIEEADLQSALGTGETGAGSTAAMFKQIDGDGNGKVTKSELSAAVEKLGGELDAQLSQSRLKDASGAVTSTAGSPANGARGGGGGAPPAKGASNEATTTKYVAAADTNSDGTVSADEEAAYKKSQAKAEERAQAQVQEYKNHSGAVESAAPKSVDVSV